MILTAGPADRKPELDLLVCGAPLRNRTVDLLLAIWTPRFIANTEAAGPAAAADPARSGPAAGRETMPTARDYPRESRPSERQGSWASGMLRAHSVRLSPARPRPGRRSDDGQTILL